MAEGGFGKKINTLVQTVGIILAAAWGVYAFVYKEILIPEAAPSHIDADLSITETGSCAVKDGDAEGPQVAVSISLDCLNKSTHTAHFVGYYILVRGHKLGGASETWSADKLARAINKVDLSDSYLFFVKHLYREKKSSVLAVYLNQEDIWVPPQHEISEDLMLHVPRGEYDYISASAHVIICKRAGAVEVDWELKDDCEVHSTYFEVAADGSRREIPSADLSAWAHRTRKEIDFGMAESKGHIMLTPGVLAP